MTSQRGGPEVSHNSIDGVLQEITITTKMDQRDQSYEVTKLPMTNQSTELIP